MHRSERFQSLALEWAQALIQKPSITPDDHGCQTLIANYLETLGFTITWLPSHGVSNLWATREREGKKWLLWAGHTDVVPPGPLHDWHSDPFTLDVRNGLAYGRGIADMKGAIASLMAACSDLPDTLSLAILLTSDEEGEARWGTRYVMDQIPLQVFDAVIIGEPSSSKHLADTLKIGRRGSLSAHTQLKGLQGHIAYPHLAINPIHQASKILYPLCHHAFTDESEWFDATSFQISQIHADAGASNIIPGHLNWSCNFRYTPHTSVEQLKHWYLQHLIQYEHETQWNLSAEPFFKSPGALAACASRVIHNLTHTTPKLSTSGGTSDGRFIANRAHELIELGMINATIHAANEHIPVLDLGLLSDIYHAIVWNM